ncbi:hypothetical protein FF125_06755 [Aureibaculum algae]|uniref:Uncharacterized protein n=1 Tax=Aureibaculum algae TaxID=2584122 RepID=A0A5B7TRU5_9FLAO|nr:hypothetical protein [Aureibaculum algae]QCX38141.1 hypothetical protein FF125_06755 [Aureibaculum algae]
MKIMNKIWIFIPLVLLLSCKENVEKEKEKENKNSNEEVSKDSIVTQEAATIKDTLTVKEKVTKQPNTIYIDTLDFVSYNDDGDYYLLHANKGSDALSFINSKIEDRDFLKGDIIEIKWIKDTIYIAGEGDTPMLTEVIVNSKKIKDGNISKFRKQYTKKLINTAPEENNYTQSFLEHSYSVVEYYIANTTNEFIKQSVQNNEQLGYSIETQTKNDKEYSVFGIFNTFEEKTNTLQWLYYEYNDNTKLYEYDLPNDELIKFN